LVNEPSFVEKVGEQGLKNLDDVKRVNLESYWTNQKRAGYRMFLAELKDRGEPIGGCGLFYRKVIDAKNGRTHEATDELKGQGYAIGLYELN
jgi:hypothetical protein